MNESAASEMIDALWAHIETDSRFTALGVKVFKMTNGEPLPIQQDGQIMPSDLPAIYVDEMRPKFDVIDGDYRRDLLSLELAMGFIFPADSIAMPNSCVRGLAAQLAMRNIMTNEEARQTNLGAPDQIDDYEFEIGAVRPVVARANPRRVLYWDCAFKITLKKLLDQAAD